MSEYYKIEDIYKQMLTNQLVIMTVLQANNKNDKEKLMLEHEKNKTSEMLKNNYLKKVHFSSLYGRINEDSEKYVDTDSIKYIKNDIETMIEFCTNKLISNLHDFIGYSEIKISQNFGIIRVEIYKSDFHFIYTTDFVGKTDTELLQEIIKFYINKILSK